ncbi:MAG TPA: enolase C-terminal domain-like protein [Methylomirabilota bacterium]|nr:enolase C-terminal domain-like protein [Methylomirabilota bacterium]
MPAPAPAAPRLKVTGLRARPVLVPIRRPPVSASGAIPRAALVLFDLETDAGVTGRSYVFGFAAWTLPAIVACARGLFDMIRGDSLAPVDLEAELRRQTTLIDPNGLIGLALSGLDMAAWDALARARGVPLVTLLGGAPRAIPAYNSTGLWIGPVDGLGDEAEALLAEGFHAIKLRVGRDDLAQDLAAVRAVKRRIGDGATLMCDFNQRLTVNEALRRARALDGEGLYWIEEPVRHDDYEGCAAVAAAVATPIQTGENLVDTFDMARAIALRSLDFVMPDVQRIGGVTGWLRAAALAHAHGIEMSSHLFPEFSVHLLGVTPTAHWLEYMDWANPVLRQPLTVQNGLARIPDRPGAGIEWDEDAVARYSA